MHRKEILENIDKKILSYKIKLSNFVKIYFSFIDKLEKLATDKRRIFLKDKYIEWFENEGYIFFLGGISYLKEDNFEKFNSFCKLYSFLLANSNKDFDKIIDVLYTIPTQFEKEII